MHTVFLGKDGILVSEFFVCVVTDQMDESEWLSAVLIILGRMTVSDVYLNCRCTIFCRFRESDSLSTSCEV